MTDFVGPFPTSYVMALLEASDVIKEVGTCADMQTAMAQKPAAVPAVFVVPEERGGPVKSVTGEFIQDVSVAIQCVMFVRNYKASGTGSAALEQMESLDAHIRGLLLAKRPSRVFTPTSLGGSRSELYVAAYLVSQSIYKSAYRIQVKQ